MSGQGDMNEWSPLRVQCKFCSHVNFPSQAQLICGLCGLDLARSEPSYQAAGGPLAVEVPKPWLEAEQSNSAQRRESLTPLILPESPKPEQFVRPAPIAPPALLTRVADGTVVSDETIVSDETFLVVASAEWVLEFEDGTEIEVRATDVVIGRRPSRVDGATSVVVPDATRTVSKTHARLREQSGVWSIEDLGSTNGTRVASPSGDMQEVLPGNVVSISEGHRVILGTVSTRLRRHDDSVS